MQQAGKRLRVIKLLLVWQFLAALGVGALALLAGPVAAWSALLGGLICWLPNCYFAFRAFRYKGARAAKNIVRSFYIGEAGKMAITVLLFALVFSNVRPLHALALFTGFVVVQTLNWFVPLYMSHSETRQISQ